MNLAEFLNVYTVSDGSGGRKIKATTTGGVDDPQSILTLSDASGGRKIKIDLEGGGGGIQSIIAGRNISINDDPVNPTISTTAEDITVVANYSALPDPTTVEDNPFYWCSDSQGTKFVGILWGGDYYPAGMYYSNGVSWEYIDTPSQATQAEVNAGVVTNKFVTPATLSNSTQWNNVGLNPFLLMGG